MNDAELLKYMDDNGIIKLSCVRKQIEMADRKRYLSNHPYKIWQGKDGYWRTYLPDKEKGRKMLKRKSEKEIKDFIIDYWKEEMENPTIQDVFNEANNRRLQLKKIAPSTHARNQQIFNRHYKEFGKRRIKSVDIFEFEEFLEEQISECNLTVKAFSNLKTITRAFLKRARKRKLIDWIPDVLFQDLDTSESEFKRVIKEDKEEVFDEEEFPIFMNALMEKPDLRNLGILLMFITGIRVGELVALKFSDFDGNSIKIQRTETRTINDEGKTEYRIKDFPKTEAGVRTVVIPEHYSWIYKRLKMCNPFEEYVFFDKGKRFTTNVIRTRMYTMCKKSKVVQKSPHKARRTYASILLNNNVDERFITDVVGHTDIRCTENYYHKNRRSIERKIEIVSSLPEFQMQAK